MNIQKQVLRLLARPNIQPLDAVGICRELAIVSDERREIRQALQTLERQGDIVRVRKRFFTIPSPSDRITGRILAFRSGTAKLLPETLGAREVFLGASALGTALHGDRVVVQLEKPSKFASSAKQTRSSGGKTAPDARSVSGPPADFNGRVIRILERANSSVVGTIRLDNGELVLQPDDPRLPQRIEIRSGRGVDARDHEYRLKRGDVRAGQKAVISLREWESRHAPLEGDLLEVLGPAGESRVDFLCLLRRFNLPEEFPPPVLEEAERIAETLQKRDFAGREDLRSQLTLTIDPDDARDFDDAIHVEAKHDGWLLSVHIADVAHYVKRGSALDREARRRGNSTYLAERVVPMLPERLSNGICSLKPGVDRLAHSAFLQINARGEVTSARFARTVIRSIARLTYRQAFAILQDEPAARLSQLPPVPEGSRCYTDPCVQERVRAAWALARVLRKNRFNAGSLDLDFPEVKVRLDPDGRPLGLEKIDNDISHQLIEECMLAANEAVAALLRKTGTSSVYRIHETPDPERLSEFRDKAAEHGLRTGDLSHRPEVQRLLKIIKGQPEEYLVKLDFLKSLKRATYDVRPLGHYGLAKDNYTHFTSPIRRYADLLVHRALAGEKALSIQTLQETSVHISATERNSADAEKESIQKKKIAFFEQQLRTNQPQVFEAVVTDIRPHGLHIEIPSAMLTGLVPTHALSEDRYWFDAESRTLRGRRSSNRYRLGSILRVIVSRIDAQKGFVDFRPAPLERSGMPSGGGNQPAGKYASGLEKDQNRRDIPGEKKRAKKQNSHPKNHNASTRPRRRKTKAGVRKNRN